VARAVEAGPDGIELLAFGPRRDGDGETLDAAAFSGGLRRWCRSGAPGSDLPANPTARSFAMTKVTAQMSISLDGCYAGPRAEDQRAWMASAEAPAFFRVTRWAVSAMAWRERQGIAGGEQSVDSQIIEEQFAAAGAYVMGRRMFDAGEAPWGDEPPFRAPVFVVTHREREALQRQGGTSFTFVTDGVERAVELARAAAGGKDVAIAGGGAMLQGALERGLVDELDLHIVPVIVGDGMRLLDLDLPDGTGLELETIRVIETPEALHVRFRVGERERLVLDDRGRGRSDG
jgi:dihydrofolate reductase